MREKRRKAPAFTICVFDGNGATVYENVSYQDPAFEPSLKNTLVNFCDAPLRSTQCPAVETLELTEDFEFQTDEVKAFIKEACEAIKTSNESEEDFLLYQSSEYRLVIWAQEKERPTCADLFLPLCGTAVLVDGRRRAVVRGQEEVIDGVPKNYIVEWSHPVEAENYFTLVSREQISQFPQEKAPEYSDLHDGGFLDQHSRVLFKPTKKELHDQCYEFATTLKHFVIPRLRYFLEERYGPPFGVTQEEYDTLLETMITAFSLLMKEDKSPQEAKIMEMGLQNFVDKIETLWL